jgi:hypothetical protein
MQLCISNEYPIMVNFSIYITMFTHQQKAIRTAALNVLLMVCCLSSTFAQDNARLITPVSTNSTDACITTGQWYSQASSSWAGNAMCTGYTIKNKGCAMACVAMLLASISGNTSSSYTPATLNTYLRNNGGYSGCDIYWSTAAAFDGSGGLSYYGSTDVANNWTWLDTQLANCRKVVVNVNSGGHWVLVVAKTGTSG